MGRKPAKVYTSINKAYRDIDNVLFSLLVRDSKKSEKHIETLMLLYLACW